MITLIDQGHYRLIETKSQTKILYLGDRVYAWVMADEIGEILVTTHVPHRVDHILAIGRYRLYDVIDESKFTDHKHLELFVGDGQWQGYLLLTNLPSGGKIRSRIIPTTERITKATRA